jgi:hypothetical protein
VPGAGYDGKSAVWRQHRDPLGPLLRHERVAGAPHDANGYVDGRQLAFDLVGERVRRVAIRTRGPQPK